MLWGWSCPWTLLVSKLEPVLLHIRCPTLRGWGLVLPVSFLFSLNSKQLRSKVKMWAFIYYVGI